MSKTRKVPPSTAEQNRAHDLQEQVDKLSVPFNAAVQQLRADRDKVTSEEDPDKSALLAQELKIDERKATLQQQQKDINKLQAQIAELLQCNSDSPTVGNNASKK